MTDLLGTGELAFGDGVGNTEIRGMETTIVDETDLSEAEVVTDKVGKVTVLVREFLLSKRLLAEFEKGWTDKIGFSCRTD